MTTNSLSPILVIVLSIISAGVGYLIKHFIEKRKDLLSKVNEERREHYQEFVDLVVDILDTAKKDDIINSAEIVPKLSKFYKKYILYASPGVINSFSEYFQYLYSGNDATKQTNPSIHIRKLSDVLVEMRKDLGLSNKKLGQNGENLFRAIINDFDEIIK